MSWYGFFYLYTRTTKTDTETTKYLYTLYEKRQINAKTLNTPIYTETTATTTTQNTQYPPHKVIYIQFILDLSNFYG